MNTSIKQGNKLMNEKKYKAAINQYLKSLIEAKSIEYSLIQINHEIAKKKLFLDSFKKNSPKFRYISTEVNNENKFISIIEKYMDEFSEKKHLLNLVDFEKEVFYKVLNDAYTEIIVFDKPNKYNFIIAFFYKWIWGAKIIFNVINNEKKEAILNSKIEKNDFLFGNLDVIENSIFHFDGITILKREEIDSQNNHSVFLFNKTDFISKEKSVLKNKDINYVINTLRKVITISFENSNSLIAKKEEKPQSRSAAHNDIELIIKSGLFDSEWYSKEYLARKETSQEDAIQHYLKYGAKLGFDPSKEFDTKYYLKRYKTVKESQKNPLLHYLKHGKKNGHLCKESVDVCSQQETNKIDVYISCWLRNKESIHDGLLHLYNRIRSFGLRSKFITHSDCILNSEKIDAKSISFNILNNTTIYEKHKETKNDHTIPDHILGDIATAIRSIASNTPTKEINQAIINAYNYWKKDFLENNLKLVIIWGSTCPISKLHKFICQELNINYLIMERGHFSKTIGIHTIGQFAFSGENQIPSNRKSSDKRYARIVKWVKEIEEVPYAHKNKKLVKNTCIEKAINEKRQIILFIGVNDNGSGISYGSDSLESHATFYRSSTEALNHTVSALKILDKEDFILIIKPHPTDSSDYSSILSENILLEKDYNINELISISSICITMSTTSIARCLIEEKPVVTMSLTDITGYNIAYECNDPSELISKIRSALNKDHFHRKNKNAIKFIQNLFDSKLFLTEESNSKHKNDVCLPINCLAEWICERISFMSKLKNLEALSEFKNKPLPICTYKTIYYEDDLSVPKQYRLPVNIVIPVYSDAELTKLAIMTLASEIDEYSEDCIVVINDCSPDPEVFSMLNNLKELNLKNLIFLENKKNLGFSGTVNRGIEFDKSKDVILLNSDAIVGRGFLNNIKAAAYSNYKIASVTPFSNNASVFSVPTIKGEALDKENAVEKSNTMNSFYYEKNKNIAIEVPVGHGFCLYLRRSAINQVGLFDELVFGRGYSEEVDYCLRARALGFLNVLAPSLYVAHVGGVSFGEDANAMKIKNRNIIANKYLSYFPEMREFISNDPIKFLR